jgi:hypothetical protein
MELDSYFQELSAIDRSEWNNIPTPLIKALKTLKKCLAGLHLSFKTSNDELSTLSKKVTTQLDVYDSDINSIQRIVANSEITLKKQVKEINEKVKQTKSVLQTNLSTEIEYMKKNYDGKFLFNDTQIKSAQSTIKTLPKFEDVEKLIKSFVENSNHHFGASLKEEVKNWFIDPEIHKINEKFQEIEEFKENLEK